MQVMLALSVSPTRFNSNQSVGTCNGLCPSPVQSLASPLIEEKQAEPLDAAGVGVLRLFRHEAPPEIKTLDPNRR